ncbi:hypothetical protein SSABA_v1c08720 [Spiroplasma sabaudiense Ar-1343]|uniref:Transmembrane protein n=1 Tax=Spiroplasma sabaudiense Ar-1343 TaxID=1276257 RepID=W6ABA6_9MOLU|nr:hypothetical protein [Spiroplasma sabaudiense]AHI54271.1 hypothetical protein SSABA_v1c08720 [Spiroplasma sabaudiense Ar-1343]
MNKISDQQSSQKLFKDWKFWAKLWIGILPLFSVIFFISFRIWVAAQNLKHGNSAEWPVIDALTKMGGTQESKWKLPGDPLFNPRYNLQKIIEWNLTQRVGYTLARNLFLYTTLSNLLFSYFFINSAIFHKNEGRGKIDNPNFGIFVMTIISITCFTYLGSLIVTDDTKNYDLAQWISLFLEHSVVPIIGVVYFIYFYNHGKLNITKASFIKEWLIVTTVVFSYFVLFTIIGFICRSFDNAFPWALEMSTSGYFPYGFLELDQSTAAYTSWMGPTLQFFSIVFILMIGTSTAFFFGFKIFLKSQVIQFDETQKNQNLCSIVALKAQKKLDVKEEQDS